MKKSEYFAITSGIMIGLALGNLGLKYSDFKTWSVLVIIASIQVKIYHSLK